MSQKTLRQQVNSLCPSVHVRVTPCSVRALHRKSRLPKMEAAGFL
jgi:hypothetical protein